MSTTIDEKVVEMRFNNAQFESGVQTSLSTLDKLKQALKLDDAAKGLENVSKSAEKVNFSPIQNGLEAVGSGFNAFEEIAIGVCRRIGDAIGDFVLGKLNDIKNAIGSLTFDQIGAGFDKYAEKTESVQTIMAATRETWSQTADEIARVDYLMSQGLDKNEAEGLARAFGDVERGVYSTDVAISELRDRGYESAASFKELTSGLGNVVYKGSQMDYVSEKMEQLNWFTDETSYSFTDMVNNIGKFTSNSVDLETAVTSMQGISTWAAASGANVNEAGRAMYNLSQAIATGSVKLIDWKSIENANMATSEFKQQAIDTAVAMGTLVDKGHGVYETLAGNEVSARNFNNALKDGWFTSEVLLDTLNQYGAFTDTLYEITEASDWYATDWLNAIDEFKKGEYDIEEAAKDAGMSVEDFTEAITKLSSEEMDFGRRAFQAAQEAKTFEEAINATKDAVSTGWMNIFELIFGNYEEAKELWSGLAEVLYEIFVEPVQALKELVKGWRTFSTELGGVIDGRDILLSGFTALWEGLVAVLNAVGEAFRDIFPPATSESLMNATQAFARASLNIKKFLTNNSRLENLKNILRGVFAAFDIVGMAIKAVVGGLHDLLSPLLGVTAAGEGLTKGFSDWVMGIRDFVKENKVFENGVSRVVDFIKKIPGTVDTTFSQITGMHIGEAVGKLIEKVKSIPAAIEKAFELFTGMPIGDAVEDFKTKVTAFAETVPEKLEQFKIKMEPVVKFIQDIPNKLDNTFRGLTGMSIGEGFDIVRSGIWDFITTLPDTLRSIWDKVKQIVDDIKNHNYDFSPLEVIKKAFDDLVQGLKDKVEVLSPIVDNLKGLLDKIKSYFTNSEGMVDWGKVFDAAKIAGIVYIIGRLVSAISNFSKLGKIGESFETIGDAIKNFGKKSKSDVILEIAISIGILAASLWAFAKIPQEDFSKALAGLATSLGALLSSMIVLSVVLSKDNAESIRRAGTAMLQMAAAVIVLAFAMKKIGSLELKEAIQGGVGIAVLAGVLVAAAWAFNANKEGFAKGAASTFIFAMSLSKMVGVVERLADLDLDTLTNGIVALIGVVASLVAVQLASSFSSGIGLIGLSALILSLSYVLNYINDMPLNEYYASLLKLSMLLSLILAFMLGMSILSLMSGSMIGVGVALAGLGAALLTMSGAMYILSSLDLDQLAVGLLGIIGCLTVLIPGMLLLSAVEAPVKGVAGSIIKLSIALLAITGVVAVMGLLSWDAVGKGLALMAGSLLTMGLALTFIKPNDAKKVSRSLLTLSVAMLAIAAVTAVIGLMEWQTLGVGLGFIAIAFAEFWAATKLIEPGKLAALGGALIVMSVGLLAVSTVIAIVSIMDWKTMGASLGVIAGALLAVGLAAKFIDPVGLLAVGGALIVMSVGLTALVAVISMLGMMDFPVIMQGIISFTIILGLLVGAMLLASPVIMTFSTGVVVLGAGVALLSAGLMLLAAAVAMFISIFTGVETIPDTMTTSIDGAVASVGGAVPDITKVGGDFIGGLISGFVSGIPEFLANVGQSVINAITDLASKAPEFFKNGVDFISNIISGIGQMFGDLGTAALGVGQLILDTVGGFKDKLLTGGAELMDKLGSGINSKIEAIKTWASNVGTSIHDAIHNFGDKLKEVGQKLMDWLGEGITAKIEAIKTWVSSIGDAIVSTLSGFWESIKGIGEYLIDGLISGISGMIDSAVSAVSDLGSMAINALTGIFQEHSPSKVTKQIGEYFGEGLVLGITDMSADVTNSSENLGKKAVDGMSGAIAGIADTLDSDMDVEPTIRPVLDLSDVNAGLSTMDGMIGSERSIGLAGNANFAMGAEIQNVKAIAAGFDKLAASIENSSGTTVNIYAQPGMDVNELADAVQNRLAALEKQRRVAFG